MKKYLYIFLIITGCSTKQEKKIDNYFKKVEKINSVKINLKQGSNTLLNQVPEMIFIDSLLLINDNNPSFTMKIIDLKNNQIRNFGKKGRGPNEYQSPFSKLSINRSLREFYTTDFPNYRVYNIDSIKNKNTVDTPKSQIKIESKDFRFLMSVRCNNFIIGNTYKNRFAFYDISKGEVVYKNLEYDKGGAMGNQGNFFCHPLKNKVVNLQFESEVMSIISFENEIKIKEFSWWKNTKSKQITDNKGRTYDKNNKDRKTCFLSASTSSKYIYTLYSGKKHESTLESVEQSGYTKIVYVFDWDGNPVKKYMLDKEVKSIAIDELNNVLYAASYEDGEISMVKFNL